MGKLKDGKTPVPVIIIFARSGVVEHRVGNSAAHQDDQYGVSTQC